ncbi:MAG: hypothetical protein LBE14_07225 [Treponema sp.]|nr:hypothetical protein [Treponema sp.]
MKHGKILDIPFFTLEYREGVFVRRIPPDAEDLGEGLFRRGEGVWRLPGGEGDRALAFGTVKGKALLSLINRGGHPLIAAGPRLAGPEERIVELALVREGGAAGAEKPGGGPVVMELRRRGLEAAEPLEGLPHHRWYQNTVYEIIDEETLAELNAAYGAAGKPDRFILRGEEIPRFVETRPRLIYRFADAPLQKLLAEERVFIPGETLSLILSVYRKEGQVWARPLIARGGRRYDGAEISAMMERDYLLLDDLWARRGDIEKTGVFPLGFYAGGGPVGDVKLTAAELIRRGGGRFAGFFSGLEADTGLWISRGDRETVFAAHLDFLLAWGLSGGLVFPGHREQARLLSAWLGGLSQKLKDKAGGTGLSGAKTDFPGKALVLLEKRYDELYLAPHLPEPRPLLPGVCPAFYEDLPLPGGTAFWDLLVLIEPEEILLDEKGEKINEEFFSRIAGINAGQRLGIFSDGWGIKNGPAANRVKQLFGIRGEAAEITDRLIRDAGAALGLPAFEFPPPAILRPPRPFGGEALFRAVVEAKFQDLPAAALFSELARFDDPGHEAPYAPPRVKGTPDFDRLDQGERAFFLHWRHCFRRGKYPGGDMGQTAEPYIRLYGRELCLFTGPGPERRPENHFRELQGLWTRYRDIFPGLDGFLPQWLLDFAVLYGLDAESLSPLIPLGRESGSPLLYDLYLHHHFIEKNNLIAAADLRGLVPELSGTEGLFSPPTIPPDPRLLRDFELALNAVDRYLREQFRLRLFSFFYPPQSTVRRFTAFEGMAGAGYSAYTAEWVHFSGHPPLLRFLGELYRYTEYWFNVKKGLDKKGRPPPLDEVWKQIADPVLGSGEQLPLPRAGFSADRNFRPRPKPVQLRLEFLDRLRAESDEVRELLTIEEKPEEVSEEKLGVRGEEGGGRRVEGEVEEDRDGDGEWRAKAVNRGQEKNTGGAAGDFWAGLGEAEREGLRVILREGGAAELEGWARRRGTMAALVIDGINEKFWELFGDLLVETVDEGPRIQAEYKEDVKKMLGEA